MIIAEPDDLLADPARDGLQSFEQVVRATLDRLADATGVDGWLLARILERRWICIASSSAVSAMARGFSFPWPRPPAGRAIVQSLAPAQKAGATAPAPSAGVMHIAQLRRRNHRPFGTLCCLVDEATPNLRRRRRHLEAAARDLATLVEHEFVIARESRRAGLALAGPWQDPESRTLPAGDFLRVLADEDQVRGALLSPASVLVVGAPSGSAAPMRELRSSLGGDAVLGFTAGDRLAALLPECGPSGAERLRRKVAARLRAGPGGPVAVATADWDQDLARLVRTLSDKLER